MKISSFGKTSTAKSRLILALAVACGLFVSGANAQVIVVDPTSISANESGFASQLAKTVEEYAKQIQQYETQLNQYAQMLSSIEGLSSGMSLLPTQLQQITDSNSLIQANCPGATGGGILGGLMNSLASLTGQSIVDSQKQICAQIVTTQIDKYNKTVVLLNQMTTYADQFKQVEQILASVSTQADAGRAANQAADYNNALNTQVNNWQAEVKADDAIISTLQAQQDLLAKKAMRGGNTILGNLVQAGALKAAFTINQ